MRRLAICGKPMRRYETPRRGGIPDHLTCGRKPGHPGRHESTLSLRARDLRQAPSGSPVVAAGIRRAREDACLSRRRLAALMGVTETCVQYWEAGGRKPSPARLAALEALFGRSFTTGAAIRDARVRAGLTQRALAEAVGVAKGWIWWWESDRYVPAPETWVQLELTLGPLGIVRAPRPEAAQEQQREEAA